MLCEQAPVYQSGFSESVDLLKSFIGLPLLFSDGSWINNQAIKAQGWQLFVEYVEKAKQAGGWVGKVGRLLQCLCCCVCCCRDAGRSGWKQVKKASKQANKLLMESVFKLSLNLLTQLFEYWMCQGCRCFVWKMSPQFADNSLPSGLVCSGVCCLFLF